MKPLPLRTEERTALFRDYLHAALLRERSLVKGIDPRANDGVGQITALRIGDQVRIVLEAAGDRPKRQVSPLLSGAGSLLK